MLLTPTTCLLRPQAAPNHLSQKSHTNAEASLGSDKKFKAKEDQTNTIFFLKKKDLQKDNKVKNNLRPFRLGRPSHRQLFMVPELEFSLQRQWSPKKSWQKYGWHSQKLELRKFPFPVPFLPQWKCYSESELELGKVTQESSFPFVTRRDFWVVFAQLRPGDGPLPCLTELTANTAEKPLQSGPCGLAPPRRALPTGMSHPEVTKMGSFGECHINLAALAFYSRFPHLLHVASYRNYYWRNIHYFS